MTTRTAPTAAQAVDAWHVEHAYFTRLLGLLQHEVDLFEAGQRPNYELMVDVVTYLRDYADRFHHPREDVAFAHLARHRPELRTTLAALRQEHRVIVNAGEKLLAELTMVQDDSVVPRAEVEAAAATYLVYYRAHIAREEREVLPHAAEALTPRDWAAVEAAVPVATDPLRAPGAGGRFATLRRQIALEA